MGAALAGHLIFAALLFGGWELAVRFALVDAHNPDDGVFHSSNQGLTNDGDREGVEFVSIRSVEHLLFLTEYCSP